MVTNQTIDGFKQAFMASASAWRLVRWEPPTGCLARFQTQTSLAPLVNKIEDLRQDPTLAGIANLKQYIQNLALPQDKMEKYSGAIRTLQQSLREAEVDRQVVEGVTFVTKGSGELVITNEDGEEVETVSGAFRNPDNINEGGMQDTLVDLVANLTDFTIDDGNGEREVELRGVDKLIRTVVKNVMMGNPVLSESGSIDGSIWDHAIRQVKEAVLPRVADDTQGLRNSGIISATATLSGIEFSGSDFHKSGQQVVFLFFVDDDGNEQKVVYKPSDLSVDKALFGSGQPASLGSTLGGISTYGIEAKTDDDGHPYGYMEFVDTGAGPTTAQDVQDIFTGLASNMALSAYVGLEDVHHENVLMKSSGVQVIDMEATTGLFTMDASVTATSGGFDAQLWNKCLRDGIEKRGGRASASQLQALPDLNATKQAMRAAFVTALDRVGDQQQAQTMQAFEQRLAGLTSRVVPIPTATFAARCIPSAQRVANLQAWQAKLDTDLDGDGAFLRDVGGSSGASLQVIHDLLYTPAVYAALQRGDVPYYTRSLGDTQARDLHHRRRGRVVTGALAPVDERGAVPERAAPRSAAPPPRPRRDAAANTIDLARHRPRDEPGRRACGSHVRSFEPVIFISPVEEAPGPRFDGLGRSKRGLHSL